MKLVTMLAALTVLSTQVFAFDVVGKRQAIIVESHPVEKELRSLKHCSIDKNLKVIPDTCDQIGSQEFYSIEYLKETRTDEYIEASLKTLADVGIVVAAVFVGAELGAAALASGTSTFLGELIFGSFGYVGGGVAGAASGLAITAAFDKMNPIKQFKQAASLSDDLVNDVDIKESDNKIQELAALLNEIL